MSNPFFQRSVISAHDFTKGDILYLLNATKRIKEQCDSTLLRQYILASCFFEPSTRTRLSFDSAMLRLGGQTSGFSDKATTSQTKGETLYDTIKNIGAYADLIVLRHPKEGAARWATEATDTPIINAGDGSNQHPTQTFSDLYTILECQGTLDGLKIAIVGDIKYGRAALSLISACCLFDIQLFFVSPPSLFLPEAMCEQLREKGMKYSFHSSIDEIIDRIDILYVTRLQKERFIKDFDVEEIEKQYRIKPSDLNRAKETLKILHPLPRVQEIAFDVDQSPHAHYFEQSRNALFLRKALLSLILKQEAV